MNLNIPALSTLAVAAYYRQPVSCDALHPRSCRHHNENGQDYFVLKNLRDIIAVYRVRMVKGEPKLTGLKRWPKALAE